MSAKTIGRTVGVLFLLAYVVYLAGGALAGAGQPAQSCWRMLTVDKTMKVAVCPGTRAAARKNQLAIPRAHHSNMISIAK